MGLKVTRDWKRDVVGVFYIQGVPKLVDQRRCRLFLYDLFEKIVRHFSSPILRGLERYWANLKYRDPKILDSREASPGSGNANTTLYTRIGYIDMYIVYYICIKRKNFSTVNLFVAASPSKTIGTDRAEGRRGRGRSIRER